MTQCAVPLVGSAMNILAWLLRAWLGHDYEYYNTPSILLLTMDTANVIHHGHWLVNSSVMAMHLNKIGIVL